MNCTFIANRAGSMDEDATDEGQERDQDGEERNAGLPPWKERRRRRRQGHGIGGALAAIASSPLLTGCSFWNNTAVADMSTSSDGGEWGAAALYVCVCVGGDSCLPLQALSESQQQ